MKIFLITKPSNEKGAFRFVRNAAEFVGVNYFTFRRKLLNGQREFNGCKVEEIEVHDQ